ncbi:TRAP transporter substrate-binding protein [Aeromicrobium sp. 50.2.37]|uniref:TRAP transporter substrate-binding protein n=1 Tax=Aeromicrobium sp. 50.2.37 TaxID=2969305 RepID=UPI00215027A7|nr:TRAP transporter substrate-binding protein [Aeromicrobium sp. 50.2.37]MCR4514121.1 TRAP transporter substrate-binding protein [Aeromicrobium sp. 50.2.37]
MKIRNARGAATITATALAMSLGLAACGGGGGEGDSVTMRLGHVFPEGSEIDEAADSFAAAVEERTDGAVTIDVFAGGQIGSDEEMATALNSGTQEAAILSQGSAGFGDPSQLGNLPYLVSNSEQADEVFFGDGFIAEWDKKTLKENGIIGLEFVENGFRALSNSKRKVESPDDVKGLKVRAPSTDMIISIFDTWGAQATAIPFPELYTALEQGTVDGQENGVTLFRDSKFGEVQKYFTDTRYTFATAVFSVSETTWNGLSEDQQSILQEEAEKASLQQRKDVRANVQAALDELKGQIDVTVLSDEQLEEWKASTQPVYEQARKTFGSDTIDDLLAAVDAAQS